MSYEWKNEYLITQSFSFHQWLHKLIPMTYRPSFGKVTLGVGTLGKLNSLVSLWKILVCFVVLCDWLCIYASVHQHASWKQSKKCWCDPIFKCHSWTLKPLISSKKVLSLLQWPLIRHFACNAIERRAYKAVFQCSHIFSWNIVSLIK